MKLWRRDIRKGSLLQTFSPIGSNQIVSMVLGGSSASILHSPLSHAEFGQDVEPGELMKPALDGKAVNMAAVSTGDLKAGHGSAEYIQGIENQRAMKVGALATQLALGRN